MTQRIDSKNFDKIDFIFEKANNKEVSMRLLDELQSEAFIEAKTNCHLFRTNGKSYSHRQFDFLSEAEKNFMIYALSDIGLSGFELNSKEGTMKAVLSPCFRPIFACTMFSILNRLQKLDGVIDLVHDKVKFDIHVPKYGKDCFVHFLTLLVLLYPWVETRLVDVEFVQ